jgi:nucleotide-binding universal stress UspA family protein
MASAFTIDRVLFAADLSKACEPALRCAASLANRFQARLYLLHVVPERADEGGALTAMSRLRARIVDDHDDPVLAVLCGDPAERILQKARDIRADLIVMGGCHGGETPSSAVTDVVVRRAPCPVLTVPLVSHESSGAGP